MLGSLQSQVDLKFRFDQERERTVMSHRKTGGLCHISKPYWDECALIVQLVNPTAGLFAGDRLHLSVELSPGSKVALTSPSATRFHTMPEGRAEVVQSFHLSQNSWLDSWPELLIPQRDSDTCQITRITLEKGAQMVFLDSLAPGRVAHGECYAFRRLETMLEIFSEGNLIVKERSVLDPAQNIWPLEVPGWDVCYYGALWIAGDFPLDLAELESFPEISSDSYFSGASQIAPNLSVIRLVAPSSLLLKKLIAQTRQKLKRVIPLLETDFRKL